MLENVIARAFVMGLIPALLTSVGGVAGLAGSKGSEKHLDLGLGFSAGVMTVASFTSLLLPAMKVGGFLTVLAGFTSGIVLIVVLDKIIPHEHLMKGYEGPLLPKARVKRVSLLVFAILIHNIPEGLAVGSASGASLSDGLLTALAIGIQDTPEGFAVSFPIANATKNWRKAFLIAVLSGFSETLMSVIAALVVTSSITLLAFMLSLAGGSMIYVVSHEVLPETHRYGHERLSTAGFLTGFLTMLWLDTLFG